MIIPLLCNFHIKCISISSLIAIRTVNICYLKYYLITATKKAKFFFHPDKLPNDLTEKQIQLFKDLWDELCEYEALLDV